MFPYQTYNNYLKKRFGKSVLKIPLNGGFSCPNIDGTKSRGGCIYCDNVAFSPVAASTDPVMVQLEKGIARTKRFDLFIGYFQAFSNTYAPVEKLKEIYEPVITHPSIVGIAIGTRPDCFSEKIFDYLDELSKRGIESVAHIMLGLPGESREMMLDTAKAVAKLPVQGIKIHQLMVIKGTALEKRLYSTGKLNVLSVGEYGELVGKFLSRLRPDQIIHRIMADSRIEAGLVAPLWSADKRNSLQFIQNYLKENKIFQGKKF